MTGFYIHVRGTVVGPYLIRADAEQAAEFARLPSWTVERREHRLPGAPLSLF